MNFNLFYSLTVTPIFAPFVGYRRVNSCELKMQLTSNCILLDMQQNYCTNMST